MAGRENHHRGLIGVVIGNHLIHIEEVSVTVTYHIGTETVDGIFEVEINGIAGTYAETRVATFLGGT